jgi:hypothetical protein
MPEFEKKNFPLGWIPSDDDKNGRSDGLLRMDNCELDSLGVVRGIRAPVIRSGSKTFHNVSSIYSKKLHLNLVDAAYAANSKVRYVYEGNTGDLWRNYAPAAKTEAAFETVFTNGDTTKCTFLNTLGHVLCIAGAAKYKDDGVLPAKTLGFSSSGPPTLSAIAPPSVNVDRRDGSGNYGDWDTAAVENDAIYNKAADYIELDTEPTSHRAVAQAGKDTIFSFDTTVFDAVSGRDSPGDLFSINVRISDTNNLLKVRVDYFLDTPTGTSTTEDVQDYYYREWEINKFEDIQVPIEDPNFYDYRDDPEFRNNFQQQFRTERRMVPVFRLGAYAWSALQSTRSEFARVGTDRSKTWAAVKGIRVTFIGVGPMEVVFNNMTFIGGINVLNGSYKYMQVDVNNTGFYNEIGIQSAESTEIEVVNGRVQVTPVAVNAQANECWIYRSSKNVGIYYLVKKITGAAGFTPAAFPDDVTELAAAREYTSLGGTQLEIYRTALPNTIIGAIWYADRVVYLTYDQFIPSYYLDPGSYDSRFTYKLGSSFGDTCYFIAKVSEGTILIGTNNDIYSITGSFALISLPDGSATLDVNIRPLGINKPPVSDAYYVDNGSLYYLAEDGWRILSGNSTENFTGNLNLLYRKETRHGISPVSENAGNINWINCTKSKGRFLACMVHDTIDRAMHIYNEDYKYWTFWYTGSGAAVHFNPTVVFTEEDGTVLMCGKNGVSNYLYEYDSSTTLEDLPHTIRTIFSDFGAPFQRKDIDGLGIIIDTDAKNYTLKVSYVTESTGADTTVTVTTTLNTVGFKEYMLTSTDLAGIDLKKVYQIELSSAFGRSLVFYGFKWYYRLRPIQQTRLVIPATNLGDPRRKRINTWPVRVDTLGNAVTMTPRLDGLDKGASTINSSEPRTHLHYFTTDQTAIDVGYTLTGGPFEYYEFMPPNITEYFPVKARYFKQSEFNLGYPGRKRTSTWPFVLNTFAGNATLTPSKDGVGSTPATINNNGPKQENYYYTSDTLADNYGFEITAASAFELWPNEGPVIQEKLPIKAKYIKQDDHDFGEPRRKRVNTWPLKINSLGSNVDFTPTIDGSIKVASVQNTSVPQVINHYFTDDQSGVGYGYILSGINPFEPYTTIAPNVTEVFPQKAKYLKVSENDFGAPVRKSVNTWPIKLNSFNSTVTATPSIDGVNKTPLALNTPDVQVTNYYYTNEQIGVNHGYVLSGANPFEGYGPIAPNVVLSYPQRAKYINIAPTNLGESGRKKVQTWPFRINTGGSAVSVIPNIDGTALIAANITTTDNRTENYYSTDDRSGVDLGFTISGSNPFELFNESGPKVLKTYPTKVKFLRVDPVDFGINSKKRIRTIPFRLNSFNTDVTFVPNADEVENGVDIFNNSMYQTENFKYSIDTFGVNYGGRFSASAPFEFEGFGQPTSVETFPPPKAFDQIGPIDLYKIGHVKSFKLFLHCTGTAMVYRVYNNDTQIIESSLDTIANKSQWYEIQLPFVDSDFTNVRIEFQSSEVFYRIGAWVKLQVIGKETQYKYVELGQ